MMKILKLVADVFFVVSLVLLGKFEMGSFQLKLYQIVVTAFWVAGIFKFMNQEKDIKTEIIDSIKDLVIALIVIPLWYFLSGNLEIELFEPISIVLHFSMLIVIVYMTRNSVKLCGKIAYFTHAVIPIIAIILININVSVVAAVIIAVILPEPINYFFYRKIAVSKRNINEQQN